MSRRAARRPRKSSCLYLSWAFPGWNKGGGGGLFLSLRLFSTLLPLVICPPSLSLSLSPGRDGHSTASTKTIANFPFRAFYRVAIFSICHVSLYYRPVTRILLPPTFPLCPSLRFFFFFFFFIDTSPIDLFTPCPRAINRERMYYYYYDVQNGRAALKKNDFDSIKMY